MEKKQTVVEKYDKELQEIEEQLELFKAGKMSHLFLINRIQNIRKESGFEVTDKIKVYLQKNDILEAAVKANEMYIKSETLTESLTFENQIENGAEIEFDEIKTRILITK